MSSRDNEVFMGWEETLLWPVFDNFTMCVYFQILLPSRSAHNKNQYAHVQMKYKKREYNQSRYVTCASI